MSSTLSVLLLSRYGRLGASSRLRFYQYLPYLESQGFEITLAPLLGDDYVAGLYAGQVSWRSILKSYLARVRCVWRAAHFDIVWVEKEMLPWVPGWLEMGLLPNRVAMVVDYDDAVFHRYDQHRSAAVRKLLGGKIDAVMRRADLVLAGNDYLANRAWQAGARRVAILPTVVDALRYGVAPRQEGAPVTIGWIGSPSTARFLHLVAPALREMVAARGVRVVAVGANAAQLEGLPIEVVPWMEVNEVSEIQRFDIGIMPLPDEPFERGKCGYKLIQCMACGKPVVASPVGVNSVIVREGVEGFLASSAEEWVNALRRLVDDPALRDKMGRAGRTRVEAEYSLQVAAPKLAGLLRSVAE